jgi:hypothetical protein
VFPIVGGSGLLSIDLGLRGAAVGLSLLLAGVALRDRRDSMVARLGAALAVCAAASAICSAPTFPRSRPSWSLFLLAASSGGPVVFWLWARAAFDDDFVLRRWHGVLWAAMVGIELLVAGGIVQWPAPGLVLDRPGFIGCGTDACDMAGGSGGRTAAAAAGRPDRNVGLYRHYNFPEFFAAAIGFRRVDGERRQRFLAFACW